MAHDNTIPLGKPGIASFQTESWGNSAELLFGDTPAQVEKSFTVGSSAGGEFKLGSVVNIAANGQMTLAQVASGESNGTHILATHAVLAAGETMDLPFYLAGHYRQQALTYHASFVSDALKQAGVPGAPMIVISKAKYNDADFPA